MSNFYLVTDTCADEVEEKTGLRAYDTPLGTLIERCEPVNLEKAIRIVNAALYPKCTCRPGAIVRSFDCPIHTVI